jgi:hypothetical protein
VKTIISIILFSLFCCDICSQQNISEHQPVLLLNKENTTTSTSSFTTVSVGLGAVLYLINPIVLYENKKIYAGITKELSVGFGKFGEHRFAFEYSFVFTGNISHHLRFSYKYDLLLKQNIEPSHTLQGTGVLSLGGGYFTNFNKQGFFPELTYGYSLRNHKILIYPHIKIRHTFMFRKQDSDITDISFGIIFGFANPFIDVNIKKRGQ